MRSLAFSIALPIQPTDHLNIPVDGLLLDSCNVLYDATGWRRWMLRILQRLGLHTRYRSLFHVWEKDYLPPVHRGECEFCDALQSFLRALGLNRGQIEEVAITCQGRRLRWEAEARLLPGVKSTLRRLASAGIPLAVVSNSEHPGRILETRFEQMGLDGVLAAVVSSRDLGSVKPHPACYQAGLDALHLEPHQVAFVGHDQDELAGANELGMQAIAFNPTSDVTADAILTRFVELLDLVNLPISRNRAG